MSKRQTRESSTNSTKISATEKGIAYGLASAVVIVLITLVLNPRAMNGGTLAIVRFLAALAGGLSAGLFLGEVQAQGTIRKFLIRASGGFAIFIIIFLLFFYGIPKSSDSEGKPISFRYLTGVNDYPTLTLSLLNPDIQDRITLKVLSQFLGIQNPPTVYSANEVFENLQNFKVETGNENTISNQNKFQYLLYSANDGRETTSDEINLLSPDKPLLSSHRREVALKGEDDTYTFHYAPVTLPFQSNSDIAKYTTLLEGERSNLIVQYPKLSDIYQYGLKDDFSYEFNEFLRDTWIKKIIQRNPDSRGFFSFVYPYANSLQEFAKVLEGCHTVRDFVTRLMPSPYVRFLDVENASSSPVSIDSVAFLFAEKDPYELTSVDNRDSLFKNTSESSKNFHIQLKPNHHLFIPIEFGFDTKAQQKIFRLSSSKAVEYLKGNFTKRIYVAKPVSKSDRCQSRDPICIESLAQIVEVTDNFKSFLTAPEELIRKLPRRFAVGSIFSIKSIQVDGIDVPIPSPQNNPEFLMSAMFNEGSCPFLLTYDPSQKKWIELGTVINNRKSKSLKGTDRYYLGNEVKKIKLEEREPEISYIDSIEFIFEDLKTGQVKAVSSKNSALSKIDSDYVVLHQGDSLEIDCSEFVPIEAANLKIKINGYYEVVGDIAV